MIFTFTLPYFFEVFQVCPLNRVSCQSGSTIYIKKNYPNRLFDGMIVPAGGTRSLGLENSRGLMAEISGKMSIFAG